MKLATDEAAVLARVTRWAEAEERVRAALLTSTRAVPDAPRDLLSDYDVALFVTDPPALYDDTGWLAAFGVPLLRVRDVTTESGADVHHVMVLFADGTKIDFTLWPSEAAARVTADGPLPEEFDAGYRVLLDKDDLTSAWPAPTRTAFIPSRPTAEAFQALIEEFWFVATYVAKYLWRDEFLPVKIIGDYELKYLIVRRLLEWRVEIDHGWTVQPGFFGRGLQRYVDPVTWRAFEQTWVGPDREENWDALCRTIALFRELAVGVASDLGYAYPQALDDQMTTYLRAIRELPPYQST